LHGASSALENSSKWRFQRQTQQAGEEFYIGVAAARKAECCATLAPSETAVRERTIQVTVYALSQKR